MITAIVTAIGFGFLAVVVGQYAQTRVLIRIADTLERLDRNIARGVIS